MSKELPLIDFAEGKMPEEEKQVPAPDKITKKAPVDSKVVKETKEAVYVKNLADRVANLMNKGESFLSACEMVFNTEGFAKEKRRRLRSKIGEVLGRRGAKKTQKVKAYKKRHKVPKGKSFSPAQTEKMIKGAKALQKEEESRAGQTYQESDLG